VRKAKRLILAVLLLGLLLLPLETAGILRKGAKQFKEIVSSTEAQVLVTKIKAGLPNLGARVSELIRNLFPPLSEGDSL
jgi:hypothetical protein